MASTALSIGTVGITGYLLINARKVSDPGVVAASQNFAPPHPPFRNVVFTGLESVDYYFDLRESPDGVAIGTLFATYVVKVRENILARVIKYYRVGGAGPNDPSADQDTLIDPYLNGKNIAIVQRDGVPRPLFPPTEVTGEYDLVVGGGIKLRNGAIFSFDEGVVIEVDFLTELASPPVSGIYSGVVNITSNTTFDATHRNKRLRCESNSSPRQVNTMEALSSVPEGTTYYMMQNGGNQLQTRFVCQGSDQFRYFDSTYSELSISPGEFLWVEVRIINSVKYYEVVQAHHGLLQVGETFNAKWKDHPNTKPEEPGTIYDGDDWPRIWWWITNRLPVTHKIIDDNVINGGYAHPEGKEGLIVVHSTLKKFRLGNDQGMVDKGLKSFTSYGTDGANRSYDYPGGTQGDQVGEFSNPMPKGHSYTGGPNVLRFGNGAASPQDINMTFNSGKENRVKNVGVIKLRRF